MLAEAASTIEGALRVHSHEACVRIGGVSLALRGAGSDDVGLSHELEMFHDDSEDPDIEVQVEWVRKLQPSRSETVFDSGALWTLFRDSSEFVFDFTSPVLGAFPYKRLLVDLDFRNAQLILNREALRDHHPVFPLEYPADELLVTNYLASGVGVEVHGCGMIDAEAGGHLFVGHSGAGKSTTTMLWKSLRNPRILSDDRIILRLHDGELWMYGTPWHGEAAFASAGKSRIDKIFILQHGEQNEIVELSRSQAVGELFARCFPPFHSAAGLENTLDFLNKILEVVPCYQFQFVPEASAVQMALGFHG